MNGGWQRIKAFLRGCLEAMLSVAHAGKKKKVGRQTRCSLEVIASKAVPSDQAILVSNGRVVGRIINIGINIPKEG